MKIFLPGILAFFLVGLIYLPSNQSLYYWEGDIKHYYMIDTSIVLIEFKSDHIKSQNLMELYPEAETYRIKDDSTIQLVTSAKSKLLNRMKTQSVTQYPAIQVIGTYGISFVTDEISVKFKSSKDELELKKFADNSGLIYLMETSYGAHVFRVPDISKTVSVANYIQENEAVIWGSPNFVHLIALQNDPFYPDQYYLNNIGQGGGTANIDINAPEAWGMTLG